MKIGQKFAFPRKANLVRNFRRPNHPVQQLLWSRYIHTSFERGKDETALCTFQFICWAFWTSSEMNSSARANRNLYGVSRALLPFDPHDSNRWARALIEVEEEEEKEKGSASAKVTSTGWKGDGIERRVLVLIYFFPDAEKGEKRISFYWNLLHSCSVYGGFFSFSKTVFAFFFSSSPSHRPLRQFPPMCFRSLAPTIPRDGPILAYRAISRHLLSFSSSRLFRAISRLWCFCKVEKAKWEKRKKAKVSCRIHHLSCSLTLVQERPHQSISWFLLFRLNLWHFTQRPVGLLVLPEQSL